MERELRELQDEENDLDKKMQQVKRDEEVQEKTLQQLT